MPDAHIGKGATVGSVMGRGHIPRGGVDIGWRGNIVADDLPDSLDSLLPRIAKAVPAGVGVGKRGHNAEGEWMGSIRPAVSVPESSLQAKAITQMGSLGSGNHFFEVDLDEEDVSGLHWARGIDILRKPAHQDSRSLPKRTYQARGL